jgi:acetoin utilization protein AcuB
MLVKDCMMQHPIMISPDTLASEAERLMVENKIRHIPVVGDGKRLKGLVTRQRLTLKPDDFGSLNVWEITRRLSSLKVKDIMVKKEDISLITSEKTVERAAALITEGKIGCLPVVENGDIVIGIITETDLLVAFQEMLGLPSEGVRVTVRIPDKTGQFVKIAAVMVENSWGVMGIGSFPSHRDPGHYDVVLKIPNASADEVISAFEEIPEQSIIDIRDVV